MEDAEVAAQRVLVHLADGDQTRHREVEDGATLGDLLVQRTRLVDLLGGLGGCRQRLPDLDGLGLGIVERRDELVVVEDAALRSRQFAQQGVFQGLDDLSVVGHLRDELLPGLFEVRAFEAHDDVQKLRRETFQGDDAVDDRRLAHDLRGVLRIAQLRGHHQGKVVAPLERVVSQSDHLLPVHEDVALLEHGVDHGVELLVEVLEEEGLAVLNRKLQELDVLVVERLDRQARLLLLLLDPADDLHLRVHAQRPARGLRHEDAVLDAELVAGQAVAAPCRDLDVRGQQRLELEALRPVDALVPDLSHPRVVRHISAELMVEGPRVADEGRTNQAIAHEPDLDLAHDLEILGPALSLGAQTLNELRGGVQAPCHGVGVLLELLQRRGLLGLVCREL
mmetsp:Transcript_149591/g.480091  ORF Transcript_149591/g.480091 Transcript_149591/m.480091 type:complete len:394 (+) Transcript_149591:2389-3570(+)